MVIKLRLVRITKAKNMVLEMRWSSNCYLKGVFRVHFFSFPDMWNKDWANHWRDFRWIQTHWRSRRFRCKALQYWFQWSYIDRYVSLRDHSFINKLHNTFTFSFIRFQPASESVTGKYSRRKDSFDRWTPFLLQRCWIAISDSYVSANSSVLFLLPSLSKLNMLKYWMFTSNCFSGFGLGIRSDSTAFW